MKKTILFLLVSLPFIGSTQVSDSEKPVEKEFKNSIGLDFRADYAFPNFGITYRRFFEDSKMNLRFNFNAGDIYDFRYNSFYRELDLFESGDSINPILGIDRFPGESGSTQNIEIGLERSIQIKKVKFIAGADLILGHTNLYFGRGVHIMDKIETIEEGYIFFGYRRNFSDTTSTNGSSINYVSGDRNFINTGLALRFGITYDFSKRFYTTAMLGSRIQQRILVRESIRFKNDEYKELLTYPGAVNTLNLDFFASIGLHFRF